MFVSKRRGMAVRILALQAGCFGFMSRLGDRVLSLVSPGNSGVL
jgi:hypothetical protein